MNDDAVTGMVVFVLFLAAVNLRIRAGAVSGCSFAESVNSQIQFSFKLFRASRVLC